MATSMPLLFSLHWTSCPYLVRFCGIERWSGGCPSLPCALTKLSLKNGQQQYRHCRLRREQVRRVPGGRQVQAGQENWKWQLWRYLSWSQYHQWRGKRTFCSSSRGFWYPLGGGVLLGIFGSWRIHTKQSLSGETSSIATSAYPTLVLSPLLVHFRSV